MLNRFFEGYQNINKLEILREKSVITQEGTGYEREYKVFKVQMNEDIIQHALNVAEEKSKYVMDEDQAEQIRTPEQKILSVFRGVLAETASQIFLEDTIKSTVKRFDLERSSFEYSSDEYDIKIFNDNTSFEIEIRSSENYKHDFITGLEKFDIIGAYTNQKKQREEPSDFYIRPLYQYDPILNAQEKNLENFISKLNTEEITLYLVAGTTGEYMEKYNRLKKMGQNNTEFRCLWLQHPTAYDIKKFSELLEKEFK